MTELTCRRFGMWPCIFIVLIGGGVLATFIATVQRVSAAQLNSFAPFGLCAGLNVFCAMAIATGSLIVMTAASLVDLPRWQRIRRPSLILALCAYTVTMLSMLSGLTVPHRAWPAIVQLWNSKSILYGALWTLVLLLLIAVLEFLPARVKRISSAGWFVLLRRLQMSFIIVVLVASLLQQLGLSHTVSGTSQMSQLWTIPDLSLMFVLSSFCAALAILLFALWRSSIAFNWPVPASLMAHIARVLAIAVFFYLALRLTGLVQRGMATEILTPSSDTALLLLELGTLVVGMMSLAGEGRPWRIQVGALTVMCGVMLNRLNTCITALEGNAGPYRPTWVEVLITVSLVAVGVAGFAFCAKHLPVFVEEPNS